MQALGQKIKELRQSKGWSQKAFGVKINRSDNVISCYETGERIPTVDVLRDMALLFGVSVDYLLGLEKPTMLSINNLSKSQQDILSTLALEFSAKRRGQKELTRRQIDIINCIFKEFYE